MHLARVFVMAFVCMFLSGYLIAAVCFTLFQRGLQYTPSKERPSAPALYEVPEFREITLRTEDGLDLLSWYAPPESENRPAVVMFHGNSGHMGDRTFKPRHFFNKGIGLFFLEYRGYGGNPGKITEQGLYKDGRAAVEWVLAQGIPLDRIILYGESLGSGVATQLATEYKARALILEAPFDAAASFSGRFFSPFYLPVDLLLWDKFDNLSKIRDIDMPLLVIHGNGDEVIPFEHGKALYDTAREPKRFIPVEGGSHTNLYAYREMLEGMMDFIEEFGFPPEPAATQTGGETADERENP